MKLFKGGGIGQLLVALAIALPAFADELSEAGARLQAGQLEAALSMADAFLAQHPQDAQMRLLKALILGEQNRTDDAIVIYSGLIEEFPQLPEPYNNLAVLLAASGQYEKARSAFETATRLQPGYAAAHENLGNIYARMAIRSYGRALQLNPANAGAKLKVSAIHGVIGDGGADISRQFVLSREGARQHVQAPAAPTEPAGTASDIADYEEIIHVIGSWAKAWNAKDMNAYLGFYASNFQTPGGEPRKKWEQRRRSRIQGKAYIRVTIEQPHVALKDDGATVRFRQIYASDRFEEQSTKILVLAKQGGKWQIVQEHAGS